MATKKPSLAAALGARIAALRAEAGLTQEKCAWEAGLSSKGYLSRIESGERLPSLVVLQRLAKRLRVKVRDLFIFPDADPVSEAMEHVRVSGDEFAREVVASARAKAPRRSALVKRPRQ